MDYINITVLTVQIHAIRLRWGYSQAKPIMKRYYGSVDLLLDKKIGLKL